MDEAAIHTMDAWCQRMLREHALDSASPLDETLQADETRCQVEATQDYWRQNCYPLSGTLLDAALHVWPSVRHLEKDVRYLLGHQLDPQALAAAPHETLGQCLQHALRPRHALAEGWPEKAQRMQQWLDAELADPRRSQRWDRRKLQARYYAPACAALQAWARTPHTTPNLSDAARQRLSPAGMRQACKEGDAPDLPPEFEQLQTLLTHLAQLPSVRTAARRHAAAHISARMAQLKRQRASFGYADMPQRLHAALHGPGGEALRARILAQYPVALIDEFQDTSPLQYRLFDQIYRSASNDPHSALLLIGDPKQSIYGFRGADIYSYLQARQATQGRHYVLDTNHRSTTALVQALNHWFETAEQRAGAGAFMFRAHGAQDNPLPFTPVRAKGRAETLRTQAGGDSAQA